MQAELEAEIRDASRFVESLLLGLPVPSIFLSKEWDTGKLLVVDGQQRLLSLRYFYDGVWKPDGKQFHLQSPFRRRHSACDRIQAGRAVGR